MATSQFTIYTSSDPYGPGPMEGLTGSLIRVLNACLVNGYGSGSAYYKPAAGWSKALPEFITGSIPTASLMGYTQGSGSRCTLFVNDASPNATALGKEVRLTGWTSMTSLTSSGRPFTGSWGEGSGQFPTGVQDTTFNVGCVNFRKSTSTDSVGRPWILVADAYTAYFWANTGDTSFYYYHFAFGDIYSFHGATDTSKCVIIGRIVENNVSTGGTNDWTDRITFGLHNGTQYAMIGMPGHYISKGAGGAGGSQIISRKGDIGVTGAYTTGNPNSSPIGGIFAGPNGGNSLYMCPLYCLDPNGPNLRGKFRGLYQSYHNINNFSDGEIIQGGGDYAGKTFMIVKQGVGTGFWMVEISNTVDTN